MTVTGAQEFGDPCRECGYRWTGSSSDVDATHGRVHAALDAITAAEFEATAATPDWSVGQYICHVGDNDRVWITRTSRVALRGAAILHHPERGEMLSALDAIRMVVHDCHHHWWDIRRILTSVVSERIE